MATYYGQRAGAGLIIAEATDVDQSSHGREDTRNPLGSPNAGLASGDRGGSPHGGTIFLKNSMQLNQ